MVEAWQLPHILDNEAVEPIPVLKVGLLAARLEKLHQVGPASCQWGLSPVAAASGSAQELVLEVQEERVEVEDDVDEVQGRRSPPWCCQSPACSAGPSFPKSRTVESMRTSSPCRCPCTSLEDRMMRQLVPDSERVHEFHCTSCSG